MSQQQIYKKLIAQSSLSVNITITHIQLPYCMEFSITTTHIKYSLCTDFSISQHYKNTYNNLIAQSSPSVTIKEHKGMIHNP